MADQPSFIPSAWAANNSTTETIPATTSESGKASWDQGFPVETSLPLSEGGIPPKYGDFNGVLNVLSQFCLFAQAGGQFTWSSTLAYSVGSIVVGSDGSIYRAVQATTNVNPVGDTTGKWERIVSQSDITALESDIQTAMSDASNAVSNASAAQSAVTTLDANVVKLSGNQTVGGVKTFSNGIVVAGTDSLVSIKSTSDAGIVCVGGGSDGKITTGAVLMAIGKSSSLYTGQFRLFASDGTKSKVFVGTPDGTLTWDGKDIITNGGDQTIAGTKTFSISPICERGNPYFITCETDLEKGVAPSGTTYQGVVFKDKNAVEVGSVFFSVGKSSNLPYGSVVFRNAGNGTTADNHELVFRETTNSIWHFMPSNTTDINLGGSGNYRWKEVWSVTGAINTSDERLKDNIASVPDAVLDAWGDVKWSQFQMRDAITEKGADKARLHNGLIAQRIEEVFKAHGQDASRYGLFCHDAWDADEEREAGDEYSLRYEEALCMEAAYQRRRADRAEARITALEQRLAEMEAVLASLISPVGDETYAEPEQEQDAEQEQEGEE